MTEAKVLYNLMVINYSIPKTLIVDVLSIDELKNESDVSSGLFLFFNGKKEMIKFGCSYEDVAELARQHCKEFEIYGYLLIMDLDNPLTEDEIDSIYDSFEKDRIHMSIFKSDVTISLHIILN